MQDFPANSAKARARSENPKLREQPEKIERITSADAKQRKRGLGRQFKETFIEGSARMAIDYMILEVVVPAIQDTLIDALQGGVERLFRGERTRRRGTTPTTYSNIGHVNYQGMSSRPPQTSRTLSRQSRARHDFGEIELQSRRDAEDVIDRMFDVLSRYGSVTVATLYELTGIQTSHTDEKWGWTSLTGAKAISQRNGRYLLDLPDPEPLDR
ncbi:MAG TPA: hypothetical protein VM715_15800 [Candidatus Acidoferrum sp.]|nr:hypothetical protein [Candidatus Acidoferrum sp.]